MSSAPSELRYDPQHPPVALLAASDLYAAQTHHAGVAAAAAPTTTDTQTTRVQILPTAGVATPTITFPDGRSAEQNTAPCRISRMPQLSSCRSGAHSVLLSL